MRCGPSCSEDFNINRDADNPQRREKRASIIHRDCLWVNSALNHRATVAITSINIDILIY